MLYTKPADLSYTDMAIYFDAHFWKGEDDRDDVTLYKYLYLIFYMLAATKKYFHKFEDFDLYAQYAATTIYLRLIKKQRKGDKVKSILNYAKASCYALKVMYQNENFAEVINPEVDDTINTVSIKNYCTQLVQRDYLDGLSEELEALLKDVPAFIKEVIRQTPFKQNSKLCYQFYLSLLLSFLNLFTLPNNTLKKIDEADTDSIKTAQLVTQSLKSDLADPIILWNLPTMYYDYLLILFKKVSNKLSEKIKDTQNYYELSEDIITEIMATAYANYGNYSKELDD